MFLSLLLIAASQDVVASFEDRLTTAFDEETYERYLYYCRQQNLGERLYQNSNRWLVKNPGNNLLFYGCAEGLLMAGSEQEALKQFKELYKKSPDWASEIIFMLKELEVEELTWFVKEERKRTSNPTLHAELLTDFYIRRNEDNKAIEEIRAALETGSDASVFKRYIDILSDRLGKEKVSSRLKSVKGYSGFTTFVETGDTSALLKAISETKDKDELKTMGRTAEQAEYFNAALAAYKKAGMDIDEARMLAILGHTEEAKKLLRGKDSQEALELLAQILSLSQSTYAEAVEIFNDLTSHKGVRTQWSVRIAALELLMGEKDKATRHLTGIGEDDQVLFAKALLAAATDNKDSLKRCMDATLVRHPGSSFENDIILVYKVSITLPEYAGQYAEALAAYQWGDPQDAADRTQKLQKASPEIADEALLLEAESQVKLRHFKNAENCYLTLASDFSQSPLASRALFEMALLLRDKMKKNEEAKKIFKELIVKDPTSLYANLARHEI